MQHIKAHRTLFQRRAWPLAIIAGGVVVAGLPSSTKAASTCTDQNCPTDFILLNSPEIQSTKSSFKFQARISQAKLPVDDVTFNKVFVKLRDGVTTWCSQSLSNVKVRDSVLNLEVGPDTGMTCSMPLEEVIAGKNGLGFQICINNEENCLKPIALSSVPYSVKAEFARRAQQSFEADVAAQAHYAHRIAADLDLLQAPTIGTGYFDFHTPLSALTIPGLNATISNREGVMEWTPVATAEKKLNILLKTDANGAIPASYSRLDELKLHAVTTKNLGKLDVSEATRLLSTLDVTGAATMASTLAVTGATTLSSTLAVTGATTLNTTLLTKGATTLQSTLAVTGATTLSSTLGVTGVTTLNGALTAKGVTSVQNTLGVTGATTLSSTLGVTGATTLSSTLGVTGATSLGNTLQVTGGTILGGTVDVPNALTTLSSLKVPSTGSAVFDGPVTFTGAVNLPSAGISAPTLSVSGASTLAGLTATSGTFTGSLTVPVGGLKMGSSDLVVFGASTNSIANGSTASTIGGGKTNAITGLGQSTIAGGAYNTAAGSATIGGGESNRAGYQAVVGGGIGNFADGDGSTIAGGNGNSVTTTFGTVGGGTRNVASGSSSTVGGGWANTASGGYSTVAGGLNCTASGDWSMAAGRRAKSTAAGTFTWADANDVDFTNNTSHRFAARASGGVYFYTNSNLTAGAFIPAGGSSMVNLSDRNSKHDIQPLNPKQVLEKLERVPVATWRYNDEVSQALHMGPMAQDFYAAFGLGEDDKHIVTVDADGVALAAVKGVHAVTKEQQAQIDGLRRDLKSAREQNEALEARLAKLESGAGGRASWSGFNLFGGLGFAGMGSLGLLLVASRRRKDLP